MKSTSLPRKLHVIGAGGFGREVAWLASSIRQDIELLFVVDKQEYLVPDIAGVRVCLLSDLAPEVDSGCVIAVGDPHGRRLLAGKLLEQGLTVCNLVHPSVLMSDRIHIGKGSVVAAGNILTVDIDIGEHVHINLGCTVGHDAVIGAYSTLSPGVHVSGNVQIGEEVFIGTGAVIINGSRSKPLVIGDDAVIAAGACVTKNVECGAMVAGVPATRRR